MSEESLQFSEGSSDKFWKIRLEGNSFTVHYGRVGTSGQSQTKSFTSDAEARKNYDKLVAEKLKKGYQRTGESVGALPDAAVVKDVGAPALKLENVASSDGSACTAQSTATAVMEKTVALQSVNSSLSETASTSSPNAPASSAHKSLPPTPGAFKSERRNDLKPEELAFAVWNPLPSLPEAKQRPFDLDKLCEELKAVVEPVLDNWSSHWKKKCPTPLHMSKQESRFWMEVVISGREKVAWTGDEKKLRALKDEKIDKIIKHVRTCDYSKEKTAEELREGFKLISSSNFGVLAMSDTAKLLCSHWSDPRMIVDQALAMSPEPAFSLMRVFRQYVMPRLSESELEELRSFVRAKLDPQKTLSARPDEPEWTAYTVACFLRMPEEVERLVEVIPNGWFGRDQRNAFHPQLYVMSLSSKEKIVAAALRTNLYLGHGHIYYYTSGSTVDAIARAWLAVTGYDGLHLISDYVRHNHRDAGDAMIGHLKLINGPELAELMIDLLKFDHSRFTARKWLMEHSDWALPALFEASQGEDESAKEAMDIMQAVSCRLDESLYSPDLIAAIRDRFKLPDEGIEELDSSTTPNWLAKAIDEVKAGKTVLPIWSDPAVKPRILVEKRRLNLDQMNAVLLALKQSSFEKVHPLISAINEHVDRKQSEKFAWALFEAWLKNGADSKEKWAMGSIAFLGGDETVFKIVPMIKVWPGESQHPRAVYGLECLRAIGTDTALMQINSLSQKLQFKGLKQKAAECMEAIAQSRGMSKNELEDRIIPDCGLDDKGQRIFDFGPRQFKFALGADLKAMVREPDGKIKSDLPKPNTKDDAEKSKVAVEEWKLLKQQIKDIAKIQAVRMEQAMVTGRYWTIEDFERFLVHHPLMIHIIRMLVWGEFKDDKLMRSFRVTEDQTYADEEDRDVELTPGSQVRLIHAMLLSDEQKAKWQGVLLDYEIVPPFKQLERPIFKLEAGEGEQLDITRFDKIFVPAISMVGIFDRCGWRRGIPEDAGCFYSHSKHFPGAGVTALAVYQGVPVGYMMEADPQTVESCCFFKADSDKVDMYFESSKLQKIPLRDVDPIVISEVLHDLMLISAKADAAE